MSKRKITKRQAWRIEKIQQERRLRAEKKGVEIEALEAGGHLGPEQQGLLIAHHGQRVTIENCKQQSYQCLLRQNLGDLVTGDQVIWRAGKDSLGVVVSKLPRQSVLARPDSQGVMKPMAANIDQIIIVLAPEPAYSLKQIDRYLVAAEYVAIPALILFNKIDLLNLAQQKQCKEWLDFYDDLGYSSVTASCQSVYGLDALQQKLQHKKSVFVGQSGVGKSSLIASLLPDADIKVGELSPQTRHGTHTTSTARLYHLPSGGDLIDSPGIREFGLWHIDARDIFQGFREFQPYVGLCKFRDCSHQHEPGCALQVACEQGKISAIRLQSYHALVASRDIGG